MTINPNYIPTKTPGTLFDNLTGDDLTLNVRWLTALDPVYFEAMNRPIADVVVRQLVLAKAIDALQLQLGFQVTYPYVVQPRIASGTSEIDIPSRWIWNIQASLPKKWQSLRLAKIKRISGTNDVTSGYTGKLRLIFTANTDISTTELSIFYADYSIESNLTFQLSRLMVVDSEEESNAIDQTESETVSGFVTFRTLNTDPNSVKSFFDFLEPPISTNDVNSDGYYDTPSVYEIVDTVAGGANVTDDFNSVAISHGTGILTDSAWNSIPELDSDIQSWLTAFNYPFDASANRRSTDDIVIPSGLFREFNITAPAGDSPTGDVSGTYYPVWISRVEKVDTGGNQLRFYFATYNVTDSETGGAPSTEGVEFASLDLINTYLSGDVVEIIETNNLKLKSGTDADNWLQGFGRGHVVLSSLWGSSSVIQDFFDRFENIAENPADTTFSQSSTRISSFGISRVPRHVPTVGQSRALLGSSSRLTSPVHPDYDNRYVTEADQGLGNEVDLESKSGITPHVKIDRYGYTGSLGHKVVKLVVNAENLGTDPNFYSNHILPRLRILLGRDPQFGDFMYNGTRLMFYNGDTWQG